MSYQNDQFRACATRNLTILQQCVIDCVSCNECTNTHLCETHRRVTSEMRVCEPLESATIDPTRTNYISNYWIQMAPRYSSLNAIDCATSLAYLLSLPRIPIVINESADDRLSLLRECLTECNQRGTTLPLMLFATDFPSLPAHYQKVVFQVFLILIRDAAEMWKGKDAILWIDNIMEYLFYSDPEDSLILYSPYLRNGCLDDELDEHLFIHHCRGMHVELEIAIDETCLECRANNRPCDHTLRLLDILNLYGNAQRAISIIRSSAYLNLD